MPAQDKVVAIERNDNNEHVIGELIDRTENNLHAASVTAVADSTPHGPSSGGARTRSEPGTKRDIPTGIWLDFVS